MTVKELKDILHEFPENLEVFVSRDPEGNGFSPLSFVEEEFVDKDDWEITIYHPDDAEEEGITTKGVVLWP